MVMLNAAAMGGVTRSSLGTNSRVAARPPGFKESVDLFEEIDARQDVEVMQEVGEEDDVVGAAVVHIEGAAGQQVHAVADPGLARVFLGDF